MKPRPPVIKTEAPEKLRGIVEAKSVGWIIDSYVHPVIVFPSSLRKKKALGLAFLWSFM
jgi:hypothetical protein